jgi:glycosyltransferase involved in cell wall biosynthesis
MTQSKVSHETGQVPLVSIGIPTYNRADGYLKDALESALSQIYGNLEIIISDNCSSDSTEEFVRGYADPRIRYFRQKNTILPNDNFNFCLHQARGEYFLLLHDDDLIDPEFVHICMKAAKYDLGVGIIRTAVRVVGSRGELIHESPNLVGGLSTTDFFLGWFEGKTAMYLCSTLFNTEQLKGLGGFRSRHNLFQDVTAEVQLAARHGRVDVEDIKASFRKHSGELTFAAKVRHWCEDSLDLLELMGQLAPEKKDVVRREGMRFFANINYSRASAVRPLRERVAAFFLVFRSFDGRYIPPFGMVMRSTALYRGMRYMKKLITTFLHRLS